MHIKEVRLRSFRRFVDLTITELPPAARLVLLCGPNGTGKSSVFEGIRTVAMQWGISSPRGYQDYYLSRGGVPVSDWSQVAAVEFHEPIEPIGAARRALVYFRSAYRHEAEFELRRMQTPDSILDRPVPSMVDPDTRASENYARMLNQAVDSFLIPSPAGRAAYSGMRPTER